MGPGEDMEGEDAKKLEGKARAGVMLPVEEDEASRRQYSRAPEERQR